MINIMAVPQWQGSKATNARRLPVGAHRIAGLMGYESTAIVPVTGDDGPVSDGVRALDQLVTNAAATHRVLAELDGPVLTAGGECNADLVPLTRARARFGADLTLLWIDAHPDLYAPGELDSGSFHGMVVRTLLGDGPPGLVPDEPFTVDQVRLVGQRVADVPEQAFMDRSGIRSFGVADAERAAEGIGGPVYVHIDLDVLDPSEFRSVGYSEPDGLSADRIVGLVSGLSDVVGAAICEYAPDADGFDPAEETIIRRLVDALER